MHPNVRSKPLFALAGEAHALVRCGDGWRSRYRLSTLEGMRVWHAAYPTVEAHAVFFGPNTYRSAAALTAYVRDAPWISAAANARTHPRAETIMSAINPAALRLARINASLAGLQQVAARQRDLLASVKGLFDLIVANPLYLLDPLGRTYRHGGGRLGAGLALAMVRRIGAWGLAPALHRRGVLALLSPRAGPKLTTGAAGLSQRFKL